MKKKTRRCIGVILARPENEYQTSILKGIYETAFRHNMNVAVFTANLYDEDSAFAKFEFNIFSAINFDLLSGVIYLPETFSPINVDDVINAKLFEVGEKGFPVVTIDGKIGDFPCYSSEDIMGIDTLVSHFAEEHGCTRIAFMTGPKGHSHAERRLEAFRSSMKQRQLEVPEDWIYYGDFWYNEGENFVNKLINSPEGMPEVILCANEFMSCSVYKALRRQNLRVPTQLRLGCFCTDAGTMDFLTAVISNPKNVAEQACEGLIQLMEGERLEENYKVSCDLELRKSITCGCMAFEEYIFLANDFTNLFSDEGYFSEYNDIKESLRNSRDMEDFFWKVDWYTHYFREYKGIYFCLYDGWNSPIPTERKKKKPDTMQLFYYRTRQENESYDKHVGENIVFPRELMHPRLLSADGEPSAFFFRELHCFDEDFGYLVLDDGNDMSPYDATLNYFLKDVTTAMESQLRVESINYMFGMDIMTGIRNRNAFNVLMPDLIRQTKDVETGILLALCDMNGLKYINDTFGHNEGDEAIKMCARLLRSCHVPNSEREFNFRIGGDEFVKVALGDFTKEDVEEMKKLLRQNTDIYNKSSGKEYPLYISIGICCRDYTEDINVDDMLFHADREMYEHKQRLKEETGFHPERK